MTDIPSGKVPVVQCVVASWRFFLDNWLRFLPAAAIVSLIAGGVPVLAGQSAGGQFLAMLVTALADLFFKAAVLRKAVREEYVGPAGLSFGADEANLLGAFCCMMLLLLPPTAIYGIIMLVVMAGRLAASGAEVTPETDPAVVERAVAQALGEALATPVGAIATVLYAALAIYISARLIMVNAATIGERRIVFLQTWTWSKSNVARVIASMVLTALPVVFLTWIVVSIVASLLQAGAAGATTAIVSGTLIAFISELTSIPVIALGAQLYKGLRPPGFAPK